MPAVLSKKFYWLPKPSPWQDAQAWREKRRAMSEDFRNNATNLANSVANAQANQIAGAAELTAKIAAARVQAALKAKLSKLA